MPSRATSTKRDDAATAAAATATKAAAAAAKAPAGRKRSASAGDTTSSKRGRPAAAAAAAAQAKAAAPSAAKATKKAASSKTAPKKAKSAGAAAAASSSSSSSSSSSAAAAAAASAASPWPGKPDDFSVPAAGAGGAAKVVTWNVAGLRSIVGKGFDAYVAAERPDVLCLQETKIDAVAGDALLATCATVAEHFGARVLTPAGASAGYAGVAVLVARPLAASLVRHWCGFPDDFVASLRARAPLTLEPLVDGDTCALGDETLTLSAADVDLLNAQARMVTVEFAHTYVVATYTPNSGRALANPVQVAWRKRWDRVFELYLATLDGHLHSGAPASTRATLAALPAQPRHKPTLWCGDLNVCHSAADIANAKANRNKTCGFADYERAGLSRLLGWSVDRHNRMLAAATRCDALRVLDETAAAAAKSATAAATERVDLHRRSLLADRRALDAQLAAPDSDVEQRGPYTYWTFMMNARARNVGWRLDYFVASPELVAAHDSDNDNNAAAAAAAAAATTLRPFVRPATRGSDHAPLGVLVRL